MLLKGSKDKTISNLQMYPFFIWKSNIKNNSVVQTIFLGKYIGMLKGRLQRKKVSFLSLLFFKQFAAIFNNLL